MTIEIRLNELESRVSNLDDAMIDHSDRMDYMDDGNNMIQNFVVAERANNEHLDFLEYIGPRIGGATHGTANVNRPTAIKVFEPGKLTMISYYQRLIKYTEDFNIDTIYPHTYVNPTTSNDGIGYSFGFDVDVDGEGNFAICSYARHICRVYDSIGTLLFTIGIPASAGNVSDDKLYYPIKPLFLPNGNILILSYYGYGKDATDHGHLSEYSGSDGSFVATHLGSYGDGQSEIGSNICYRPMGMDIDKTDDNLLWVTEYSRGRVLVINRTTWLIENIYYPPTDYSFNNSYGIACLSDGNFAIASNVQDSIMIIDRNTKELINELDVFKVKAAADFRDLKEIKPGFLVFSGWTSIAAFVIPISDTIEIQYNQPPIPPGATLISDVQFPDYDPNTGILTRRINDLDDVPLKIAVTYTKSV